MDGILLDSETVYLINAKKCSEIYNYGVNDEVLNATMGSNEADARRLFLEHLGRDFPYDEFCENEWKIQTEYMEKYPLQLKKGVKELLDFLTQRNIKKVVATSTSRNYACKCLRDAGIYDYFDEIVCGDDLKKSKPNPDIYLKAISKFDIDKKDILVFEDSNNGLLAGLNAGLKVVHIPDVAIVPKSTLDRCYKIITDLSMAKELI